MLPIPLSSHADNAIQIQQPLIWICSGAELLLLATQQDVFPVSPSTSRLVESVLCPTTHHPNLHVSRFSLLGLGLVVFGSLLRLTCFRRLGNLFTFDLTIFPTHSLVTSGPYAYVRHPAYTGTLSMCLGVALVNLTPGSWVAECGVLGRGLPSVLLRAAGTAAWFGWWLAVGFTRCRSEDAELRKKFGTQWEEYASRVKSWFVPGLL